MKLDLVDVFSSASLKGNPLGVVHGAEQLSDAQMLALTRWLGFSETTFLLPPTEPAADYRVRIFFLPGSCLSPAIRRSAPAMPGWNRVVSRTPGG